MSKYTSDSKEKLFILLILLLALILRLLELTKHDFWFDEAFTYQMAKLSIKNLLRATLADNHPPLYYLLIHQMLKISKNEVFLRLPSTIASIFTTLMVYLIAKNQFTKKTGYLAAMLFAVSPLTVYMATEARSHSLAILFSSLMVFLFLKFIKEKSSTKLFAFVFVSIISLYTQYYIGLLFVPFTYLVYKFDKKKLKRWLSTMLICLGAIAPWIIITLKTDHNGCYCPNSLISLPQTLIWPAIAGFDSINIRSYLNLNPQILLIFAITAIIAIIAFIRGVANSSLIAKIYLVPLILLSIFGVFSNIFSPKAFSIFSPIFIILAAKGASSKFQKYLPLILFSLFSLVSIIRIINPFFRGEDLKSVYKYLDTQPTSPIYHTSLLSYYSADFYLTQTTENQMITTNPLTKSTTQFIGGEKKSLNSLPQTFWLVDTNKWAPSPERNNAISFMNANYQKYQSKNMDLITVTLFKRK